MDGDERALGRVPQFVADEHRERPVDLQLDQPVRLVPGDHVAVPEGPPEEAGGALDRGPLDQRARLGRAARRDAARPPQVVGGIEHERRDLGTRPVHQHLRPDVNGHDAAPP